MMNFKVIRICVLVGIFFLFNGHSFGNSVVLDFSSGNYSSQTILEDINRYDQDGLTVITEDPFHAFSETWGTYGPTLAWYENDTVIRVDGGGTTFDLKSIDIAVPAFAGLVFESSWGDTVTVGSQEGTQTFTGIGWSDLEFVRITTQLDLDILTELDNMVIELSLNTVLGDCNGDRDVDGEELADLAGYLGSGQSDGDCDWDLNGDDAVNQDDIELFALQFGTVPGPTYFVSGQVLYDGTGLQGVELKLVGSDTHTETTDEDGNFRFAGIAPGAYVLEPLLSGYRFDPADVNLTIESENVENVDFTVYGVQPGTFVPLGFLPVPYDGESMATGLGADGYFVVGFSQGVSDAQGFRWDPRGGMVGLGFISGPPMQNNEANAVTNDGNIAVGWTESYLIPQGESSSNFFWTPQNGMDVLPFQYMSSAINLSADGDIVVGWVGTDNFWRGPCYWNGGDLPYGFGPSAICTGNLSCTGQSNAVSADGLIMIGYQCTMDRYTDVSKCISFTYDRLQKSSVYLPNLAGGDRHPYYTKVFDMTPDGEVVVGVSESAVGYQPIRWTAASGTVSIGNNQGIFSEGEARAVSADGAVIVGHARNQLNVFIWDAVNRIRDLKEVLLTQGITEVTDWVFTQATDISADGKIIVGAGINPVTRQTEAWLVRLP